MPELVPGVFTDLMTKLAEKTALHSRDVLDPVALLIERQAKTNASNGEHTYRTRTPASPGSGPARISGTLVHSITHTDALPSLDGWSMKVGVASGTYPPYNRRTDAGRYAYYLEVTGAGRSHVRYPFLLPAVSATKGVALASLVSGGFTVGALI